MLFLLIVWTTSIWIFFWDSYDSMVNYKFYDCIEKYPKFIHIMRGKTWNQILHWVYVRNFVFVQFISYKLICLHHEDDNYLRHWPLISLMFFTTIITRHWSLVTVWRPTLWFKPWWNCVEKMTLRVVNHDNSWSPAGHTLTFRVHWAWRTTLHESRQHVQLLIWSRRVGAITILN